MVASKPRVRVKDRYFEEFLSSEKLATRIAELGNTISTDFKNQRPVILAVLNGAFVFAADLARQITTDLDISFIRYASYEGMASTGQVQVILPIPDFVEGRPVLLVEDIIDTGRTMHTIIQDVKEKGATQVRVATLLQKPEALEVEVPVDYLGFEIENRFVVGYGLDYDGYGRNLAGIYALAE
ncbi:MAG: hypoxanthine phosphoribosyltransferase [Bacteroidota bacterium]